MTRLAFAFVIATAGVTGGADQEQRLPTVPHLAQLVGRTLSTGKEASRSMERLPLSRRVNRAPSRKARHDPHAGGERDLRGGQRWLNWPALARCESSGNPHAVDPTGRYFGLYQFDEPTWGSVGGRGLPSDAPAAEQTDRARRLYAERGAQPWPACGWRLAS